MAKRGGGRKAASRIAGERRRDLFAGEPAGIVELGRVDGQRIVRARRRGRRSSATRGRARAGWRDSGRRRPSMPGFLLQLARDRRLDRFARLDEAGQRRIAAGRIMRLAAEQQAAVMLGKHDHHRVDARDNVRRRKLAQAATSRRDWARSACRRPSNSRGGGASWRGSARRRRVGASVGVEHATSSAKWARASTGGVAVGQRREARRLAVEAEEQRRLAGDRLPAQPPVLVERRGAIVPDQLRARRRRRRARRCASGSARSMIGAVEAGAGEEGVRRQGLPFEQAPPRRRGGRASAGRPRRAGRAAATSLRRRRLGARDDMQVEREMGEAMARPSRAPGSAGGSSLHSGPGSAAIPPSMPLAGRRTSQTAPSRSIHQAMPWRCGRSRFALGAGKASGVAAGEGAAVGGERAGGAVGLLRAADGRAEVHHRLGKVAGPLAGVMRVGELADFAARLGERARRCRGSRATTRSTLVSITTARSPKAIAAMAAAV